MLPDPRTSCGPYSPVDSELFQSLAKEKERVMKIRPVAAANIHHDTIGIVAVDVHGNFAGGTTTNGATFKIPGFVATTVGLN